LFTKHTSKDIIGTKSHILDGKRIVLCITGSVAAFECPRIARELMRHGAEVFTVMSFNAQKIIHPYLMEYATGNPVITDLTGKVEHVALAGDHPNKADLILVAPATANTISKIACGIDDTPVTTVVSTALGSDIPIVIVPAMHESMYKHQIIGENIEKLKKLGVWFVGPRIEEGKAKMAEVEEIVNRVIDILTKPKDMKGLKVLVTAGPTREYIDAIRFISNPSSGKMGVAIAEEALVRGAEVTLIYGRGTAKPPSNVKLINVETTEEMLSAVVNELKSSKYDVFISTAAVLDYGPKEVIDQKTPSGLKEWTIKLRCLPKVVCEARRVDPDVFIVGFKAEYKISKEELIEKAYRKLKESGLNLIVANDVGLTGRGFESDTNEVYVVDPEKNVVHIPLLSKRDVAAKILDVVVTQLAKQRAS